jgi:hypothetical protein
MEVATKPDNPRRVERLHRDYIKKQRAEVEFMFNGLSTVNGSPAELETP